MFDTKKQETEVINLTNEPKSVDLRLRRKSERQIIIFMLPLCDINRLRVHILSRYMNIRIGISDRTQSNLVILHLAVKMMSGD